MGLNLFGSLSVSAEATPTIDTTPNPNPYVFKVKKSFSAGDKWLLWVNYPNCTTFGGDWRVGRAKSMAVGSRPSGKNIT
jgi:hypothetical protein